MAKPIEWHQAARARRKPRRRIKALHEINRKINPSVQLQKAHQALIKELEALQHLQQEARIDALAEATKMSQAVENHDAPTPPSSPPRTDRPERAERADRATAADRARALETNALREAAAKAAADLARVMVELDTEKKENHASKAATPVTSPAPTNASSRPKKSAAAIRTSKAAGIV
jgi:hypothetical protein